MKSFHYSCQKLRSHSNTLSSLCPHIYPLPNSAYKIYDMSLLLSISTVKALVQVSNTSPLYFSCCPNWPLCNHSHPSLCSQSHLCKIQVRSHSSQSVWNLQWLPTTLELRRPILSRPVRVCRTGLASLALTSDAPSLTVSSQPCCLSFWSFFSDSRFPTVPLKQSSSLPQLLPAA